MPRVPKDMSRRQRVPPHRTDAGNASTADGGAGSEPAGVPPGDGISTLARRPPPWEKPSESETASFGGWLRRQREMREITLRDIADRTKISMRYLEAMEEDRFDLLPAPIFAKGFLREYARYVGLSPDEVVNHYLAVQQQKPAEDDGVKKDQTLASRPYRGKPVRSWTYGLFLALAVLGLIAVIWALAWYNNRRHAKPSPDAALPGMAAPAESLTAQPGSAPAAAAPEKPSAPLEVSLDFTANCWVDVKVDGEQYLSEERVQGESLPIEAQRSVSIKLGDTGAAEIQVNGLAYPLNGKSGEVREVVIDLETVRKLQEKKEAL